MINQGNFISHWNELEPKIRKEWNLSEPDLKGTKGDLLKVIELIAIKTGEPEADVKERLGKFIPYSQSKPFEEGGTSFHMPFKKRDDQDYKELSKKPLIDPDSKLLI